MIHLSQHFTLAEMTKSDTAIRRGIDNTPSPDQQESLRVLCESVLEPIRKRWGPVRVNSGFRSRELNGLVGGQPSSQHMRGEAADIEVPGVDNMTLWRWIRDNVIFDQVILEHYDGVDPSSGWVHVSYSRRGNRRQALRVG